MNRKTKLLLLVAAVAVLLLVGTAIVLSWTDRASNRGADAARSPLGALFGRAAAVSDLKTRMGELRELHPALAQFAQAHQDDLPKSLAELHPYLPAKLAYLDDAHWELAASGKLTALVNGPEAGKAILLQEKGVLPEHARIIVYGDGHIEYHK